MLQSFFGRETLGIFIPTIKRNIAKSGEKHALKITVV
jgi:hypothetical protein